MLGGFGGLLAFRQILVFLTRFVSIAVASHRGT
jgi:hypothetical protein